MAKNTSLKDLFLAEDGPLPTRINWKSVQFVKVKADNPNFKEAYKVIIDGVVVGAVGRMKKTIHSLRPWAWVTAKQSFNDVRYHTHSYGKRWATSELLFELAA